MRKKYQRKVRKSNHKFEIVQGQELMARVPLPMAEVWAEMQARVEELQRRQSCVVAVSGSPSRVGRLTCS